MIDGWPGNGGFSFHMRDEHGPNSPSLLLVDVCGCWVRRNDERGGRGKEMKFSG